MATTLRDRLLDPDLRAALVDALAPNIEALIQHGPGALADDVLEVLLARLAPEHARAFTGAHLRIVHLLAEEAGATHTRLRRRWDAKASRAAAPWPLISDSGIRTRTRELVAWGLVEDTGAKGETVTGRPSTIWALTATDRDLLGADVAPVAEVHRDTLPTYDALLTEAGNDIVIRSHLERAYALAARLAAVTA